LYPTRQLRGIPVVFTDIDADRAAVLQQIDAALTLLDSSAPRRARQLAEYVRRIVVWSGHYSSAVPPATIQLSKLHFAEGTTLELASTLVHEVVHLRIARSGIPYDRARERIERHCVREQAEFLRLHGDEGAVMAEVYENALSTAWWTDEAHVADIEQLIADAGAPRWLLPLLTSGRKKDR
jgi:hypothetical protein